MEKTTNCNDCRLKEFNLKQGNLCSLTHQKPEFEGTCPNFEELPENEKPRSLDSGYAEERISGWLVIFLWLGLGGGALMTIYNTLPFLSLYSSIMQLIALALMATVVITAVAAIYAFYKRKPNAVSLAITYIVMVVLDGVSGLIIGEMTDTHGDIATTIRPFVWAGIWFSYLMLSNKVANLIPKETRRWCLFDKVILGVNVLATAIFLLIYSSAANGSISPTTLLNNNIEALVRENNSKCPIHLGEDMWMIGQEVDGNEVIITTKLNTNDTYFSKEELDQIARDVKYEMMMDNSWIQEDPFSKLVLEQGYLLTYKYVDSDLDILYSVTFRQSDFE